MQGLFRIHTIDHHKQHLYDDVLLLPQFSHTLIVGALLLWVLVVFVWLFTSHYTRKETVVGWLEPPQGIIRVYAEATGIVQKVLVAEGEQVTQDQSLLIVSDDRILASGDHLDTKMLSEYNAQQQFLNGQLVCTQSIYEMHTKDIEKRIVAAEQDLVLVDEQVERYHTLKRDGHVSTVDYNNAMSQKLSLKSAQQAFFRNKITQKNILDQLRFRVSNIAQQITQLNDRNSHIIKAPRAGIVNNVHARAGQQAYANNNIPLLTLFPNDS